MFGELKEGELFADRYEIRRILGRGGMSVVYLVYDREEETELALKTLLPKLMGHSLALHRFMREMKAMRVLDHPCVVKVHDADEVGKFRYYTMDYVKGKSVRQLILQRGRLGMGSTVRILALVCHALQHMHKYTIHRDISPENIMVQSNGNVKILDFGLAKLIADSSSLTQVGTGLGKEQYCSPEQLEDATQADFRSDLFSVGVMFYEMLSGRLPTSAKSRLTLRIPGLPPECDSFVAKAMATNPDDRFTSAREMRKAMQKIYDLTEELKTAPEHVRAQETIETPVLDIESDAKAEAAPSPSHAKTPTL